MEDKFLREIREKRAELQAKGDGMIDEIIVAGNERARARIKPIVEGAMERVGLITRWG